MYTSIYMCIYTYTRGVSLATCIHMYTYIYTYTPGMDVNIFIQRCAHAYKWCNNRRSFSNRFGFVLGKGEGEDEGWVKVTFVSDDPGIALGLTVL